jgi:hypothetical protein
MLAHFVAEVLGLGASARPRREPNVRRELSTAVAHRRTADRGRTRAERSVSASVRTLGVWPQTDAGAVINEALPIFCLTL